MSVFWCNFKRICDEKKVSPRSVAMKMGLSEAAPTHWKNGKDPRLETIKKAAEVLRVRMSDLTGEDVPPESEVPAIYNSPVYRPAEGWVPVLGNVAAGIPSDMIQSFDSEDPDDWEQLSPSQMRNGSHVALRINGISMEPKMSIGDVVIVRLQDTIEDGEIAIVKVNGGEATCKKIKKTAAGITLLSFNPAFPPIFYTADEAASLPVEILGKVVELRAKF